MRREHQAYGKQVQQRLAALCVEAGLLHELDGLFHRLRARLRVAPPLPLAEYSNALAILGEVHQVEKHREGTHDDPRLRVAHRADAGAQRLCGPRRAFTAGPCAHADFLLEVEQDRARLFLDHVTEHPSQEPDLRPELLSLFHACDEFRVYWAGCQLI